MTELIGWVTDWMAISFGTIGTTEITLGLMITYSLVATLVLGIARKLQRK